MLKSYADLQLENLRLGMENQRLKETECVAKEDNDIRREPVNATVLQALVEVTNALQDASGLTDNEGGDYTQEYAPVIEEARRVIEQAEREYKPSLFIGTPTGIEDIDKVPDEPDYDNQATDLEIQIKTEITKEKLNQENFSLTVSAKKPSKAAGLHLILKNPPAIKNGAKRTSPSNRA